MQAEISIAKQLSGPECLDSCIATLRNALVKDDRFMPHMAYHGYTAEIAFKFTPYNSFAPPVDRVVSVFNGDLSTDPEASVTVNLEIPLRSPNVVREEAELPTPVLVTDGKGNTHEEWKHTGKAPTSSKVPHNKVR